MINFGVSQNSAFQLQFIMNGGKLRAIQTNELLICCNQGRIRSKHMAFRYRRAHA